MRDIETTNIYIYDALPLAYGIEGRAGKYLIPYEQGIYIKGHSKPSVLPGQKCFIRKKNLNGTISTEQITNLSNIPSNIYSETGELLIPHTSRDFLSRTPSIPVTGMKIITAYSKKVLFDYSEWCRNRSPSIESVLSEFILPEYRYKSEIYDFMEDAMMEVRTNISDFIKNDTWVMHFIKVIMTDIFIEKTIDYRVHWYNQYHSGAFDNDK